MSECDRCQTDHAGRADGSLEALAACVAAQANRVASVSRELAIRISGSPGGDPEDIGRSGA
jgi:hypothetical protein